jgi:hypothetical protein
MSACKELNCSLNKHPGVPHELHSFGTTTAVIQWQKGRWQAPDGRSGETIPKWKYI